MARKTTKKKTAKKSKAAKSDARTMKEWFELGGRLTSAVVVLCVVVGWIFLRQPLSEAVAHERAVETPVGVDLLFDTTLPKTNPSDTPADDLLLIVVKQHLVDRLGEIVTNNPLDHRSLEAAHERLLDSGWFEEVTSIRRLPAQDGIARIKVEGIQRVYAAIVIESEPQGGTATLISTDAHALEVPRGADVALNELLQIQNPTFGPPEKNGQITRREEWLGGDVQDAIELFVFLSALPEFRSIIGIDLSNYDSQGLRLITDRQGILVWGRGIGENAPGETSDQQKLNNFQLVLNPNSRLDEPDLVINIKGERVTKNKMMRR
ncbi:MAG: hypothetical protein AAGB34_09620 [Planctomycetota bacterium]